MWNDPARLNIVSRTIFLSAWLALLAASTEVLLRQPRFYIKQIIVKNPLSHVNGNMLATALKPFLPANMMEINLEELRRVIATLPFVKQVEIRRVFPDTLEIEIREYHPVARWRNGALIAEDGTVFSAISQAPLPMVFTEEATIELSLEILKTMRSLFAVIDKDITALTVTPRQSVAMRLSDGTVIIAGRDDVVLRVMRFIRLYPRWQKKVAVVDLRYTHGFATREN